MAAVADVGTDLQLQKLLVEKGANPVMTAGDGNSALSLAACCVSGQEEPCLASIDLFLDHGVDIDAPHTVAQVTALMKACQAGSPLVPQLLGNGASVSCEDNRKRSPLMYVAVSYGWLVCAADMHCRADTPCRMPAVPRSQIPCWRQARM